MINTPPVDLLIEQLETNGQPASRYCLYLDEAKSARQIIEQTTDTATGNEVIKEFAIASREIASGKIKCAKD